MKILIVSLVVVGIGVLIAVIAASNAAVKVAGTPHSDPHALGTPAAEAPAEVPAEPAVQVLEAGQNWTSPEGLGINATWTVQGEHVTVAVNLTNNSKDSTATLHSIVTIDGQSATPDFFEGSAYSSMPNVVPGDTGTESVTYKRGSTIQVEVSYEVGTTYEQPDVFWKGDTK